MARSDLREIQERLPHPHQDEIGESLAGLQRLLEEQDLPHDLGRGQVTPRAHQAGETETAGQGAAHLGGDAGGQPIVVWDQDALDLLAVRQPQQELPRPIVAR